MLTLFKFLVFGHLHKWKIIKTTQVMDSSKPDGLPMYFDYNCQCEKCGTIRMFRC